MRGYFFIVRAGRERVYLYFLQILFLRPDFRELLRSIRSVQNYNRFLVYLTIYRSIEI